MIIGDSSALIALATIDKLDLLEKLFNKVYVPEAVFNEVSSNNKPQSLNLSSTEYHSHKSLKMGKVFKLKFVGLTS